MERNDISKYKNSLDSFFIKNCTVRLVRDDLNKLRDLLTNNSNRFNYNICAKVYRNEKWLRNHKNNKHLLVNHEKKPQKRVSFSDKVVVHDIAEYHSCRKCSKLFESYSMLKIHMKHDHKKQSNKSKSKTIPQKSFSCDHCQAKFGVEFEYFTHQWTHYLNIKKTNQFKYKIGIPLPDHFKPKLVLNRIQIPEKVVEKKPLDNIETAKVLNGEIENQISERKSRRTLISKHKCEICAKYFSNSYCLKRHTATVHMNKLQCAFCEEVFAWPALLQTHNCIRKFIPELPFYDARPEIPLQDFTDKTEIPIEFTDCDYVLKSTPKYKIVLQEVPIEF